MLCLAFSSWDASIAATARANLDLPVRKVCEHFHYRGPDLGLSTNETRLLCGSPEHEAWGRIPPAQADYFFRSFLQGRGYFNPTMYWAKDSILADLGERSRARDIEIAYKDGMLDGDDLVPLDRWRKIVGETLTPALIDESADRAKAWLRNHGYACAKVEVKADAKSGKIRLTATHGPKLEIRNVEPPEVPGLHSVLFPRFWAFRIGDLYRADNVTLTNERITNSKLVQSSYFESECKPEGVWLKQQTIPGPPRWLRVGLGVSTEQLLFLKASWRHSRFGWMGSDFLVDSSWSFREQELFIGGSWYFEPRVPRFSLDPSLTLKHEQYQQEFWTLRVKLFPSISFEFADSSLRFSGGPNYLLTMTTVGSGAPLSQAVPVSAEARWMDHDFELHLSTPQSGHLVGMEVLAAQEGVLSPYSARSIRLQAQKYWNIRELLPPLLVAGVRMRASTTHTGQDANRNSTIPSDFRYFLGGSRDLRGYSLKELPRNSAGAFTSVTTSLEARLVQVLPFSIEPLVFLDAGALGVQSFSLDTALYLSPGLGIRWQSPIGTVRTSLAHGIAFPRDPAAHLQFFIGLGEEF